MGATDPTAGARRGPAPPGDAPGSPALVVLAHEAPLQLGAIAIEPALRRLVHPDGREEFVQPRVMQVLVALARADGAILSRDDLLSRCWGGVVVGEDAINRVMTHLRRLSDGLAEGAFKVETITKVGYRLVSGAPTPVTPAEPRTFARPEPLLAVLAFDNLSGDPDFLYFSDGVSEEVLHTVAKTTALKVVGRSSSFQLRGADKAARRVAEALNATHLLDGSVRRSGDRVRITAQLVDCETQTQLWSDRFDRPLADVFALQDEIASAIAAALNTAFAPSRPAGQINPEAYDLYLQGRRRDDEFGVFNVDLLERAIRLQPDFAQAWALLAFSLAVNLRWGGLDSSKPTDWDRMRVAANRALALDPSAGIAYLALAVSRPVCGALAEQRALTQQALAVAPNDPIVLINACGDEDVIGRSRLATEFAAKAYALDPNYAAAFYAAMLDASGRREEANAIYDRALERWPEAVLTICGALRSAYERRDWERYDRLKASLKPPVADHWLIGFIHYLAQSFRDWTAETTASVLAQLQAELSQTGAISLTWLGLACAAGLNDEIYGLLEQASFTHLFLENSRFTGLDLSFNVLFSPVFAAMRQDRRFVRFCAKLGFCDYWVQTGYWPDCADEVAPYYDFRAEVRRLTSDTGRG